jgi:hypothetical protein
MKRFTAILFSALLSIPVFAAPPTQQGTYEARVQAMADLGDVEGNVGVPIEGNFGYYLTQNIQLGGEVLFGKKDFDSYWGKGNVWGLGVYGEFNVDWDFVIYPYVGVGAMLLDDSNDKADRGNVFQLTVSPGIKVFLTDYISLSLQANWESATDDIYDFKRDEGIPEDQISGSGKTSALTGAVAIRFLFY